jgi:hypothetical protein
VRLNTAEGLFDGSELGIVKSGEIDREGLRNDDLSGGWIGDVRARTRLYLSNISALLDLGSNVIELCLCSRDQ